MNAPRSVHSQTIHGPFVLFGVRFEECCTGGNCVALRGVYEGVEVLITGYNEAYLPTRTDWSVGFYDADQQQFRLAAADGTNRPLATALTTAQVVDRIKAILPIAKRDPSRRRREDANAELLDLYADMARRDRAGDKEARVALDVGSL